MDTWGISGPTFVAIYGGILVAVSTLVLVIRYRLSSPGRAALAGLRAFGPSPYEVAMLKGGDSLVLTVAACRLKESGCLSLGLAEELTVAGSLPPGADPVENWVYAAVQRRPTRAREVLDETAAEAVLAPIRQRLWALGLLLEPRQRSLIRVQRLWFVAVLGLGIARLVAGVNHHRPIGFLFLLLAVGAYSAYVISTPPIPTRAGRGLLNELKGDSSALGAYGFAADVALSGVTALWAADAALAGALGLKRGTGGFSGGGGCGGGGCGGGCGG